MCDRPAPVSALCPRVEISPVAVVVLALACPNKNNYKKKERKFESGVLTTALLQMGRLACQQHQNALLSVQGPLRAEL